jgi:hypothetical protein
MDDVRRGKTPETATVAVLPRLPWVTGTVQASFKFVLNQLKAVLMPFIKRYLIET